MPGDPVGFRIMHAPEQTGVPDAAAAAAPDPAVLRWQSPGFVSVPRLAPPGVLRAQYLLYSFLPASPIQA